MADHDRRIVDLYDGDNPDGPDHDFYRSLADEVAATSILDLGCGTGLLTVTLAGPGRTVVGVDPSAHMLDVARTRAGADSVAWHLGDSRSIPPGHYDYAVMTGNVAQHILEIDWMRTLRDVRTALRPGGVLAFESRNPATRAWESWNTGERTSRDTPHGVLIEWMEATETSPGIVELTAYNTFVETDETVVESDVLTFRDRRTLEDQLNAAGFDVSAVHGDWARRPFTQEAPVMVFVALAR